LKFNLSKFAQTRTTEVEQPLIPEYPLATNPVAPQTAGLEQVELPSFSNHTEMFDFLYSFRRENEPGSGYNEVWNGFFAPRLGASPNASMFEEALKDFYQQDENSESSADVVDRAFLIYSDMISPSVVPVDAIEKAATAVDRVVEASDEQIAILAERVAKSIKTVKTASKENVFNLTKQASHGDMDKTVIFGPTQVRPSPIIRDVESNLSALERNKSNQFFFGGIYDIDFETLWRGNVMDKYYRPFDGDHGLSGGGYIEDRFEVNKVIPVGNDLRVPADGSSRPFIPEFRSFEARMSAARGDLKGNDGRVTFAPFNFSASKKKG
jgi:hypothetical protein